MTTNVIPFENKTIAFKSKWCRRIRRGEFDILISRNSHGLFSAKFTHKNEHFYLPQLDHKKGTTVYVNAIFLDALEASREVDKYIKYADKESN